MKLGDLFWVKTFELKRDDYKYSDTIKVMEFMREKFDLDLTFIEAYTLWECFSGSRCAGWLCMSDSMLEEFIDYFEFLLDEGE